MRKLLLIVTWVLAWSPLLAQQSIESALLKLDQTIKQAGLFDSLKEQHIQQIKTTLSATPQTARRFDLCLRLYEEYKSYRYDSAYSYALKLQDAASQLNDKALLQQAKLKICFSLLSAGLFKDASDSLNSIKPEFLPAALETEYFLLLGRFYYDMADYANDSYHTPGNVAEGSRYIDSALVRMPPGSVEYEYYNGLKNIRLGDKDHAQAIFRSLLARSGLTDHEIALTTSTLSDIYIQKQLNDTAILLLIDATIADLKSSTKETSAAYNLATLLYRKGKVKDASTCIQLAISDAAMYGARHRKVRITDILPLIESEKLLLVKKQEKTWITYAIIVTLLLIGVAFLTATVLRQVKKLKLAQQAITQAHIKELEINHRLIEANNNLQEANNIKEEYIGYFFSANSEFFDKIERFKKSLETKIRDRKFDEIKGLSNKIDLKAEKDYLLADFDRIFLKLFPHFKGEFNALFNAEDRIELKEGELMNTDLRIFALIRLGISDTDKIAHILQYSVNTINTYKTRIKNKSIVPNDEFERRIMQIQGG